MKRIRSILILVLSVALLLAVYTGCSSSPAASKNEAYYTQTSDEAYYDSYEDNGFAEAPASAETAAMGGGGSENMAGADLEQQAQDLSEKIIYQGSAVVETTQFDESLKELDDMISRMHGFVERTEVTGQSYESSYYKKASLRRAEYTIRVPKSAFTEFKEGLSVLGYVTNTSYWSENITAQYMDVESRLNTYRAEESSLLAMMEKAESVGDMITIESRLSEVRYEIESLTSTLRYYQNQVDYSTMTLSIREVTKIVEEEEVPVTYWGELKDAFKSGWSFTVDALGGFGKFIVAAVPALIIPAVIVVVIVLIVKNRNAKKRAAYAAVYANPQQPINPNPPVYGNPRQPADPGNPGNGPQDPPRVEL